MNSPPKRSSRRQSERNMSPSPANTRSSKKIMTPSPANTRLSKVSTSSTPQSCNRRTTGRKNTPISNIFPTSNTVNSATSEDVAKVVQTMIQSQMQPFMAQFTALQNMITKHLITSQPLAAAIIQDENKKKRLLEMSLVDSAKSKPKKSKPNQGKKRIHHLHRLPQLKI